jgi:hypothetical protein
MNYVSAIIILNTYNLCSSISDGINLIRLYNEKFEIKNIDIITDNQHVLFLLEKKIKFYRNMNIRIQCASANNFISIFSSVIKSMTENFIINISSHGYCKEDDHNYIIFNGTIINDYDFNNILTNNMNSELYCLALIDACQSGTMFNLNYKTKNLIDYSIENMSDSQLNIICIGAVDVQEYDMDDISELGFGGGLTSAFLDYYYEKKEVNPLDIKKFFLYYKNRINDLEKHPVLSFNNLSFL